MSGPDRQLLVRNAYWLASNAGLIDYGQARPFPLRSESALRTIFAGRSKAFSPDCSMCITNLYFISGAKDPTGYGFRGYGNTASMMGHLKNFNRHPAGEKVSMNASHPGGLIVYGVGLPLEEQHVVMVVEQGDDPLVFSHGSAFNTQMILRHSWEQAVHGGFTVSLDVSTL